MLICVLICDAGIEFPLGGYVTLGNPSNKVRLPLRRSVQFAVVTAWPCSRLTNVLYLQLPAFEYSTTQIKVRTTAGIGANLDVKVWDAAGTKDSNPKKFSYDRESQPIRALDSNPRPLLQTCSSPAMRSRFFAAFSFLYRIRHLTCCACCFCSPVPDVAEPCLSGHRRRRNHVHRHLVRSHRNSLLRK